MHAAQPPVLFYRRYLDQWSGGDVFDVFPQGRLASNAAIHIQYDAAEMYAYALPDRGALARRLNHAARRARNSVGGIEASWFINAVRDAISTSKMRNYRSTLVVVREVVNGMVEDDEIVASMDGPIPWLTKFLGGKRK